MIPTTRPILPNGITARVESKEVNLLWGLKIPMRDGVHLNATVFMPQKMERPLPLIITLTPYIADGSTDVALYFAQQDYIFAMVDTRGRGNSEGECFPFLQEPNDAYDLVEGLAVQPWCNGQVGMWGMSYFGFTQWAALKGFPAHLKTISPAASAHPGVDFPSLGCILYPFSIQWLTNISGVTGNGKIFTAAPQFWIQKYTELQRKYLPFSQLDKLVGNPTPYFDFFNQHCRLDDPVIGDLVPTPQDYARFSLPILTITGHYDGAQPGALHYYRQHMKFGCPESKEKHFLVIGPWDHAAIRNPDVSYGGMSFGKASLLDMNRLHREWYDWTLKGAAKPTFLQKRVAYYVCGAEEWEYADSLEDVSSGTLSFFLGSPDGKANDVFRSGWLSAQPCSSAVGDSYVYDPLDTRLSDLERVSIAKPYLDQRYVLNLFGNGLVYHTEPFNEEIELSGCPRLSVWIQMDVVDTDFHAVLYEILADGTSILLTDSFLRARYRNSTEKAEWVSTLR